MSPGEVQPGEQHLVDSPEVADEQQPDGQQHADGSSPCQLGHGDEAGDQRQRRREERKVSLDGQGSH